MQMSLRAILSLCIAAAASGRAIAVPADYTIASFGDEFNDTVIDTAKWNTGVINYPSGNTWLYRNHPGNNVEAGGNLVQTTLYQDVTGDGVPEWTCSSVSAKQFRQRFGYWEARMKLTQYRYTDANWWSSDPAGVHYNQMDGFEIDAPEAWGSSHYTSSIYDHNSSLVSPFQTTMQSVDMSQSFNTYGFEWATDNSVKVYFNGTLLYTHSAEFFNSIEALIPQSPILGTALWTTGLNASNQIANGDQKLVDWARVYQKPGWIGTSAMKNWNDPANWGPDGVPGSGRAAVFNTNAAVGAITLSVDQPVQEIAFQTSTTGVTTINGPGKLLLGATTAVNTGNVAIGGINLNNDTTRSVTINADIVAQRKLQFSNYAGTVNYGATAGVELVMNGSLTAATTSTPINFLTTGPIRVNGAIGDSIGAITKGGQGTVHFNTANAFTGTLDIRDGVVLVNANGALGSTGSGVTMSPTGSFDQPSLVFSNVAYTLAEPVAIAGDGSQNAGYQIAQGAIDVSGNGAVASFAGPITVAADATIGFGTIAQAATLNLSGAIDVGDRTLTLNGGGTLNLTGAIRGVATNGVGQIVKTGNGIAVITGPNTQFKGSVVFRAGTVSINSINALGGGTGDILRFDGGTLSITAPISTSKGGSFSAANGTINTNGQSAIIGGAFSGSGGLTKVGLGTLTMNGSNSYTGATNVSAGALVWGASQMNASPLIIGSSGTARLASSGSRVLVVPSVSIVPGGILDLTNNAMVIDYSAVSPISNVRQMLADGRIVGATGDASRRLGYAEAMSIAVTSVNGYAISSDALVVRYVLIGDANLDGVVGFDDLLALAQSYNDTQRVWTEGDFDYDGIVGFGDLLALAQNYGSPGLGTSTFNSDWAMAQTLIPEPTAWACLGALGCALTRRRCASSDVANM